MRVPIVSTMNGLSDFPRNGTHRTQSSSVSRSTIQLYALSVALTAVFCCSQLAHAQVSDGDWGLTLSAGTIIRTGPEAAAIGPHVGFRASRGLHPLWNVYAEAGLGAPVPFNEEPAYAHGSVFVGVSSQLDITKIVPWIGLAGGMLIEPKMAAHERAVFPSIMASLGVDVRKHRRYSMGIQADVVSIFEPAFDPARYVRVSYRFTWMKGPNNF